MTLTAYDLRTATPLGPGRSTSQQCVAPRTSFSYVLLAVRVRSATAVQWVSHSSPATVRLVARSRAESTTQMRRVVAQGPPAPVLAPEHSLLAVPRVLTPALAKKLGGPPSFVADALREGIARWTGDSDAPVFELVPSVRVQTRARVVMDAKRRAALRGSAAERLRRRSAARTAPPGSDRQPVRRGRARRRHGVARVEHVQPVRHHVDRRQRLPRRGGRPRRVDHLGPPVRRHHPHRARDDREHFGRAPRRPAGRRRGGRRDVPGHLPGDRRRHDHRRQRAAAHLRDAAAPDAAAER